MECAVLASASKAKTYLYCHSVYLWGPIMITKCSLRVFTCMGLIVKKKGKHVLQQHNNTMSSSILWFSFLQQLGSP